MGSVHYQPLQKHSGDLLLDDFCISLGKQREQGTTEIMCMTVRISQLICYGIKEKVAPYKETSVKVRSIYIPVCSYLPSVSRSTTSC